MLVYQDVVISLEVFSLTSFSGLSGAWQTTIYSRWETGSKEVLTTKPVSFTTGGRSQFRIKKLLEW
jgi:hypothetical protein